MKLPKLSEGWETIAKHSLGGLAFFVAFLALISLLLLVASHCDGCRKPEPLPLPPIDASAQIQVIDERLDAAVQTEQATLREIAARHDAAIAEFTEAQRAEWERVQAQGDHAVEAWINDWYARERGRP